ncbi:ABC transporter ATP-binding protein [Fuchsiella alkaliacetigena]|uniref:ABC transporter ATP-binding protein n=1 Tax=Fuchsiella alkaliacetigena TaxID=957042 RepID=UPI002009E6D0|nr:ABC transporter ATP-binding protein [Fuchsiella alkaliacetigena]MCK8825587.1 ABC transporter ATP-binding protein [Fuchsiella alkaliacetigena]
MSKTNILEVNNLQTHFYTKEGIVKAVDGVSFEVKAGETLGIVGESGSGKSVTATSIMQLLPASAEIVAGEVDFKGSNLLSKSKAELQKIRGNEISMIFQEPMTALNPVYKIGNQLAEVFQLHQQLNKKRALKEAKDLLAKVGIPSPQERLEEYPHQLSGGMRQRVMIAMALAAEPQLIIADEPTTALDVTIQAQILDLLQNLQSKFGLSLIFITHDLGIIAEIADRVIVMYAGQVMESAAVETLFEEAKHPYTQGLIDSIPSLNYSRESLVSIKGVIPDFFELPAGCKFSNRCDYAIKKCFQEEAKLELANKGQLLKCWRWRELERKGLGDGDVLTGS